VTGADPENGQADPAPAIPYGDQAVFELMAKCGMELERFVRRRLHDDADAIKIVDQCWVDLVRTWKRRGELREPRALLFRIAHHRAIDRIRQLDRRAELRDDGGALDDIAAALMIRAEFVSALVVRVDVQAALAELPVRQQQAVLLVDGYGLSYRDAGSLMVCSANTVAKLLGKARSSLRKSPHLAGYGVSPTSSPPEVHK
jgi:RNA polymerase sigma factor (sigma-70 family)